MTRILFTNVNILDCGGDEPYPGEVLVEGNRIAASPAAGPPCPATTRRSWTAVGRDADARPDRVAHTPQHRQHRRPGEDRDGPARGEHADRDAQARLYLDCGITSCISAAAAKPRLDVVIRNAINAGEIAGPRLLAATPWLTVTGGLGDMRTLHMPHVASMAIMVDGPENYRARHSRADPRGGRHHQARHLRRHVRPPRAFELHGDERSGGRGRRRGRPRARQAHERPCPQCGGRETLRPPSASR